MFVLSLAEVMAHQKDMGRHGFRIIVNNVLLAVIAAAAVLSFAQTPIVEGHDIGE